MKFKDLVADLAQKGLIDERKAVVVANAKSLPGGEYGFSLLCLNGHTLNVYDIDLSQNMGDLLYTIDLRRVTAAKASANFFNRYLKLTYDGFVYKFADFGTAKEFATAVLSETRC